MKKMNIMFSATILLSLSAITQSMDENPTPGRRPSFDATRDSHPLTSLLFWTQASRAEWTAVHEGETQIHYGEDREVRFGSKGEQAEIDRLAAIAPSTNKETQNKIAAHILMLQSKMRYNTLAEEYTDTPTEEYTDSLTEEYTNTPCQVTEKVETLNITPIVAKPAAWTDKKTTQAVVLQGLSGEEKNTYTVSAKQLRKKQNRKKYKI